MFLTSNPLAASDSALSLGWNEEILYRFDKRIYVPINNTVHPFGSSFRCPRDNFRSLPLVTSSRVLRPSPLLFLWFADRQHTVYDVH